MIKMLINWSKLSKMGKFLAICHDDIWLFVRIFDSQCQSIWLSVIFLQALLALGLYLLNSSQIFTFINPCSQTIVAYICQVIPLHSTWLNPPIHRSDQNLTSPHNIYILPNKRVIRILKVISAKSGYLDLTPYSCN